MSEPLVSILMMYRVDSEENVAAIHKLFDSIEKYFDGISVEILIKLDLDDEKGIKILENLKTKYSFIIRPFIFHRWEGRWTENHFYNYFLLEHNSNSKFFVLVSGDIVYTRNIVKDIKDNLNNNYCILGRFSDDVSCGALMKVKSYRDSSWLKGGGCVAYSPIISVKLVEIMSNFGYSTMVDSTFGLLNIIMFKKYGISLAKSIKPFTARNNIKQENDYGKFFNQETLITWNRTCHVPYFYELMEQQARNIYLNMKEDNLIQ